MTTAFVTGATGLLGNNLVRMLLERGYKVRALIRNEEKAEKQFGGLDAPHLELVVGDMADVAGFASAIKGVDVVFHTAAYFRDSYKGGKHFESMVKINVDGTDALLASSYAAGVRRFVHVSSTATVLPAEGGVGLESDRRPAEGEPDDYFRSKILADAVVEKFLSSHPDFDAAFILPGFMVGPGDIGPTSSGQMVLDFSKRKLPGVFDAGMSFVDARDVAGACVELAENLKRGERYLVAGTFHTVGKAYELLSRATDVPSPKLRLPSWFLLAYAWVSEVYARLSGRPVLLSWAGIQNLRRERNRSRFDSSKAEQQLSVRFRPLEETFRDTWAYYIREGWLSAA